MTQENIINIVNSLDVIDVNILSFILLLFTFLKYFKRTSKYYSTTANYLNIAVLFTLLELAIESTTYVTNHSLIPGLIPVTTFLLSIQYPFGVLASISYILFMYEYITDGKPLNKKYLYALAIPLIYNIILYSTNSLTGFSFTMETNGVYHRGLGNTSNMALGLVLIIVIIYILIKNRNNISKKEMFILSLFVILPLFGTIFQLIIFGSLLTWSMTALSLSITYFTLSVNLSRIDELTGAYTRSTFEKNMETLTINKNYGFAFLDLDNFKSINDTYGHAQGDVALKVFCQIILKHIGPNDMLARYGGDEFVLYFNNKNIVQINKILEEINESLIAFNKQNKLPFEISFSYGYGIFDEKKHKNYTHLLKEIDTLMYEKKLAKKISIYVEKLKTSNEKNPS